MNIERGLAGVGKKILLGVNMVWASPERIERVAKAWGLSEKEAIRLRQEAHLARAGREEIIYGNTAEARWHANQAMYLDEKLRG